MEKYNKSVIIKRINNGFINKVGNEEFAYTDSNELIKVFSAGLKSHLENCEVGKSIEVTLIITETE